MIEKSESNVPKIGYVYHYPKINEPTDKFRLDIFISSTPTEKHFDVLRAHLSVKAQEGTIERLTISHPWTYGTTAEVCAGLIVMEDRKGKREEAFTFGGKLNINRQEEQTICIVSSSAPVLELSGVTPVHQFFIEELEILLAERKARYPNRYEYETLLCKANPIDLYRACLDELIEKFDSLSSLDDRYLQLLKYLHSQEHRLHEAGLARGYTPSLDDIFKESI